MRTIDQATKTLLKSSKMIGDNKPTAKVTIVDEQGGEDGGVLDSMPYSPSGSLGGLAYHPPTNTLIGTSAEGHIYDIATQKHLESFPLNYQANGAAVDGDDYDTLWATQQTSNQTIDRYDLTTKIFIESIVVTGDIESFGSLNGLASPPGPYLWVGYDNGGYFLLKILKSTGEVVSRYNIPNSFQPSGVTWDGTSIWVSGYGYEVWRFDPGQEKWIDSFSNPTIPTIPGLTFDGAFLWGIHQNDSSIVRFGRYNELELEGISNLNISRGSSSASSSCSISVDNKGGKYTPDNEGSPWFQILYPGKKVIVKQGYGSNIISTFTGYIDSVRIKSFPQTIEISCRDVMKKALDQSIKKLTFKDMEAEDVFMNLAKRSGFVNVYTEATGVSVVEKTFEWESYANGFDYLAEISGFEYFCDEDGNLVFRKPKPLPDVSYTFSEGEDISSVQYVIDDSAVHDEIYITGKNENGVPLLSKITSPHWTELFRIPEKKYMKVDVSEKTSQKQIDTMANRLSTSMAQNVMVMEFDAVPVPWLQVGDTIEVKETSTQSLTKKFRVTDIRLSHGSAGSSMKMSAFNVDNYFNSVSYTYNNVTPKMTSKNTPSPYVVSESDAWVPPYPGFYTEYGWYAFDQSLSHWHARNLPSWVKVDFGASNEKVLRRYAFIRDTQEIKNNWEVSSPMDFNLKGSNDNKSWTVIDSQTGINWNADDYKKDFYFLNETPYRYYLLQVTKVIGGGSESRIRDISFYTLGEI